MQTDGFNPCRWCKTQPVPVKELLGWKTECCGTVVEDGTFTGVLDKWNRRNPNETVGDHQSVENSE